MSAAIPIEVPSLQLPLVKGVGAIFHQMRPEKDIRISGQAKRRGKLAVSANTHDGWKNLKSVYKIPPDIRRDRLLPPFRKILLLPQRGIALQLRSSVCKLQKRRES